MNHREAATPEPREPGRTRRRLLALAGLGTALAAGLTPLTAGAEPDGPDEYGPALYWNMRPVPTSSMADAVTTVQNVMKQVGATDITVSGQSVMGHRPYVLIVIGLLKSGNEFLGIVMAAGDPGRAELAADELVQVLGGIAGL